MYVVAQAGDLGHLASGLTFKDAGPRGITARSADIGALGAAAEGRDRLRLPGPLALPRLVLPGTVVSLADLLDGI